MSNHRFDSDNVLRIIDTAGAEASHTDDEARRALEDGGVDPDRFVDEVQASLHPILKPASSRWPPWEVVRSAAFGLMAASAVFFVVSYHVNARAAADASRQMARAQLIGPLLPGLASADPERRSIALVVARQVDPSFASDTAKQLTDWDVSSQAQARASRNSLYASRILSGMEKLELSRDPNDRKAAIWDDLLPVLLEARKNRDDFVDVAIDYQRVLPLLRVRNPDVFLDSYWGELWILNILLDSKIAPVVDAARQQAPDPAVVKGVFDRNASSLPDRDKRAFEEAVTVYEHAIKGLR
jgi:hypothetical protein